MHKKPSPLVLIFLAATFLGSLTLVPTAYAQSVTQPISIATPAGGTAFVYTVSGCSVSPTSGTSGSVVDFTATASCVLTVTMPTPGTNTRYVFASSASSTTVTTCASGTCTTFSPADYYQLLTTFQNSEVGGASGYSVPWHFTQAGASTAAAITTTASSVWVDYSSIVYPEAYNYHSAVNTATQQFSATPLTYGAQGIWPLSEATSGTCTGSVYDLSHNNNTGTCVNSPTYTTGPWSGNGALSFNAVNSQYVTVSNNNQPWASGSPLTISFWMKYTGSWPTSTGEGTMNDYAGAGTAGWIPLYRAPGEPAGQFLFLFNYLTTSSTVSYVQAATSGWSANTWYNVVLTRDSSGNVNWYRNGVNIYSATASSFSSWKDSTNPLKIGAGVQSGYYWNGFIADVRFYNYALSPSLIQERYASTPPQLEHLVTTGGSTLTTTFYNQYSNTLQITPLAQTTFDSGLTYSPTLYSLGTQITFPAITPASGAGASTATVWSDSGKAITSPASLSGSGANIRWENGAGASSTAGTPTTGGNTYNTNYYKQLSNTYSANPVSPTTFSASITLTITGTYLGTASSTICTVSVPASPASGAYSCAAYADYSTAINFPTTSGANPVNTQWHSEGVTSFSYTTGGNTATVNYVEQLYNTFSASPQNPTTFSPSITFPITGTSAGVSTTICTIAVPSSPAASTSYSCAGYSDYDTPATFPLLSTNNPPGLAWEGNGTLSYTFTTGGNTETVPYYEFPADPLLLLVFVILLVLGFVLLAVGMNHRW